MQAYNGLKKSLSTMVLKEKILLLLFRKCLSTYIQGSIPQNNKYTRQYFYYADEHGQLFLHDTKMKNFTSCLKDIRFLDFFTKRLKRNNTGMYVDFPYISPCGKELNFIQVADRAIVFKSLNNGLLTYGGTMTCPFQPENVTVGLESGWLYHTSPMRHVDELGLIASHLAIDIGRHIVYGPEGDPFLVWEGHRYAMGTIP